MDEGTAINRMDPGARGISASFLKQIAVLTMLIDHVTAGLLDLGYWAAGNPVTRNGMILYRVLRGVGRIAFPIYCFLIVEGFFHTRNKWKYLLRLTAFGLLSEIPFDICFERAYIYMDYQNVFFTLALGLLGIILYDTAVKGDYLYAHPLRKLAGLIGMAAAAGAAWFMKTDYSWYGVLVIYFFFLFRESFVLKMVFTEVMLCLLNLLELVSLVDFPLFLLYNGQRGHQKKYFYYIFYPAHLLLIAAARYVLFGVFVR